MTVSVKQSMASLVSELAYVSTDSPPSSCAEARLTTAFAAKQAVIICFVLVLILGKNKFQILI